MSTPEVTFIIPLYNAAETIDRTMISVLAQTVRTFEVLLVDDGSSDGTLAAAQKWAAKDARVKVLQNPCNQGVSAARNRGLDHAGGEFVRFIDADDTIPEKSTAKMTAIAKAENADMVMGVMRRISAAGAYNYGRTVRAARRKKLDRYDENLIHSFSVCNKLFRRAVIEAHGIRFAAYRHAEDGLFLYEFLQYTNHLCGYAGVAYVYYKPEFYEAPVTTTQHLTKEMLEGVLTIADRILAMHPEAPQRFRDDFRARVLGITLINEYYRKIWRLDPDALELLMQVIPVYWEQLPEKQRKDVLAMNRDLPAPDELGLPEEICSRPLFTVVIGSGVTAAHLPALLASLYYQKVPYFNVVLAPCWKEHVPQEYQAMRNLSVGELDASLSREQTGQIVRVEEDVLFTYESLSRALTHLPADSGAVSADKIGLTPGTQAAGPVDDPPLKGQLQVCGSIAKLRLKQFLGR